jgi:hypothetical protein
LRASNRTPNEWSIEHPEEAWRVDSIERDVVNDVEVDSPMVFAGSP